MRSFGTGNICDEELKCAEEGCNEPAAETVDTDGKKGESETERRKRWKRVAYGLACFSVLYCVLDGVLSCLFGWQAESVALRVFGLESIVETASALIVVWRLRGDLFGVDVAPEAARKRLRKERVASRAIGTLLLLLGLAAIGGSVAALIHMRCPVSCTTALIIASVNLVLMMFVWQLKLRAAKELDSHVLAADARCSCSCGLLSLVVLVSATLFMADSRLWWSDAACAMLIGFVITGFGARAWVESLRADYKGGCSC